MPRILRRDNIDLFQDVEGSQRDIAQVTNRRRDYVKHFITSCKLDAALSREVHPEPNKANWLLPNESLNGGKNENNLLFIQLNTSSVRRLHNRTHNRHHDHNDTGDNDGASNPRCCRHPATATTSR